MQYLQIFPLSGGNPSCGVGFALAFEWEKSHQQSCEASTLREKSLQQSSDFEWGESTECHVCQKESVLSPPSEDLSRHTSWTCKKVA